MLVWKYVLRFGCFAVDIQNLYCSRLHFASLNITLSNMFESYIPIYIIICYIVSYRNIHSYTLYLLRIYPYVYLQCIYDTTVSNLSRIDFYKTDHLVGAKLFIVQVQMTMKLLMWRRWWLTVMMVMVTMMMILVIVKGSRCNIHKLPMLHSLFRREEPGYARRWEYFLNHFALFYSLSQWQLDWYLYNTRIIMIHNDILMLLLSENIAIYN